MSVGISARRAAPRFFIRLLQVAALLLLPAVAGAQTITILSPNGGEGYELSRPVTVSWTAQGVTSVRLDYSADNGNNWTTVAPLLDAARDTFTFTPNAIPTRTALVRLVDPSHQEINDLSDRVFDILAPKSITIYSPTGGERVPRGSKIIISWDASRVEAVDLFYSINDGASWLPLASNIHAFNWSYEWTVPDRAIRNVKVRVQEAGGSLYGESGTFEIVDPDPVSLVVEYPNGGERFTVGDSITIRWAERGLLGAASISYSTDLGATWTLIRGGVPVINGAQGWRITSAPGTSYLVKVEAGSGLADQSDAPFEVARRLSPKIQLLTPNGGEKFLVDQPGDLIWTMTDVQGDVTVEYSVDSGGTWKPITTAKAKDGQTLYSWPVPDDTTSHALIRVFNAEAGDTSDAFFAIVGHELSPIIVLVPNGGEIWKTGERRTITWTVVPSITAVDIYLSTDGGGHWGAIASNVATGAAGSTLWLIPAVGERGAGTASARIRVQNHASALENDLSDRSFTINTDRAALGVDERGGTTGGFHILGVYPNPSSGSAELRWLQGRAGAVELRLYNADGGLAATCDAGGRDAGENSYRLDAGALPAGHYLFELLSPGMVARGSLVIVK